MCPGVPGNISMLGAMAGGMDRLPVAMNTAAHALDLSKKKKEKNKKHGHGIMRTHS